MILAGPGSCWMTCRDLDEAAKQKTEKQPHAQ
jgi:hypothetical protein